MLGNVSTLYFFRRVTLVYCIGSKSFKAIEPNPKNAWLLIVVPGATIAFAPIQAPSSMTIGDIIKSNVCLV